MPKWRCYGVIDATIVLGEVEAETEEEAKAKAEELEHAYAPSLCHQCASRLEVGDMIDVIAERVEPASD